MNHRTYLDGAIIMSTNLRRKKKEKQQRAAMCDCIGLHRILSIDILSLHHQS